MRCGAKFNLVPGLNTIKSLGMTMQELAYKGWLEGPTPEMSWMFCSHIGGCMLDALQPGSGPNGRQLMISRSVALFLPLPTSRRLT